MYNEEGDVTTKILIGCEYSGIVRDAFIAKGHDARSCDLLPTEREGPHWQGDLLEVINQGWDMAIFHPPCTHLAVSGARWFKDKVVEQREAIDFFMKLVNAPIPRIAIENPIGIMSTRYRKPDQIVHPWWFGKYGENESKATCLWLKGLPKLIPDHPLPPPHNQSIWRMGPSPERSKERSRTFMGVANAFAEQWG